ncbi:MAG: hypothetical protein JWN76_489 [Chitinophagaceae bacterium]|nr:hypothetical protein [Chitinophagaceae bacterium]
MKSPTVYIWSLCKRGDEEQQYKVFDLGPVYDPASFTIVAASRSSVIVELVYGISSKRKVGRYLVSANDFSIKLLN